MTGKRPEGWNAPVTDTAKPILAIVGTGAALGGGLGSATLVGMGWLRDDMADIREDDGLRAANAIASRQPDPPGTALEIDMDLEVSHRETIRSSA